jgi:hypothetical protein
MGRKLDLSGVRIYSDTKRDILDALDLIGEEVYFSDWSDFRGYDKGYLLEVRYAHGILYPFLGGIEMNKYKYLILAKDAKFKDEKSYKIFRPYESIDEFCIETGCVKVGTDLLTIRNKRRKQECVLLYTGYSEDAVHLGGYVLTFDCLLKHYEFYNKCGEDGEWHPFGVEE